LRPGRFKDENGTKRTGITIIEGCVIPDGSSACQVYRASLLKANGHFMNVIDLVCRTYEEAIEQAHDRAVSCAVEIWVKDRKVAYIPAP
jgi:hypothetical protein